MFRLRGEKPCPLSMGRGFLFAPLLLLLFLSWTVTAAAASVTLVNNNPTGTYWDIQVTATGYNNAWLWTGWSSSNGSSNVLAKAYYPDHTTVGSSLPKSAYPDLTVNWEMRDTTTGNAIDSGSQTFGGSGTGGTTDSTPPATPIGLKKTAVTASSITLGWTANGETDVSGYNLYRDGVKINGYPITGTTYTDNGLQDGVEYSYQITAVDSSGNESALSSPVLIVAEDIPVDTTPPNAPTITVDSNLEALQWTKNDSSASGYNVYKDGVKQNTNPITNTMYDLYDTCSGNWVVTAIDDAGNESTPSNAVSYTSTTCSNPGSGGTTTCDVCTELSQLLQCPDWDTYMGDLTRAIAAAIPPPPDWDMVAGKIGDAVLSRFENYFGPIPNPPSTSTIAAQITPQLPTIDTSTPEVSPDVPAGFEQPKSFDITAAPEIPVVDESQPFMIQEPTANIHADDPGVMVFPGDSRNSSDGIKQPDMLDSGYNSPVPTNSGGYTSPETPPADMPTPMMGESVTPLPTILPSDIPIPTTGGGA